ncbi:MAG TPA: amidohydrolase [Gaiellaceae bacterium]|nr:amidohydrolase [Gaiellaceae bacterium]
MSTLVSPDLEQQTIAWRRHLHANPELSFEEVETSRYVEEALRLLDGLEIARPAPTAVVATLRGARPGRVLALRADMDALPIQEESGLEFASTRPGVMHACGHDGHTAMLLGTAQALTARRDELAGEVRFLFQHAEEKLPGGARQLVEAGVMDGVDLVVGAHLASMKDVGKVGCPIGPMAAAADTFAAQVRGRGGHAAAPHRTVDPIVVASQVVTNLQQLVSRGVDPIESAVVSVTRFHAGTADNIIPEVVELGGTVRTFDAEVRAGVRDGLERVFRGVTEAHGATYTLAYEEGYSAVINDAAAAETVLAAARAELGDDAIMDTEPIMGGEDFSAYLAEAPGAFFWVGAGSEDAIPHHHPRFTIDESAFRSGIAVFVRTALDYLR